MSQRMARPGRKRVVRAVRTVCVNVSGLRDAPWPRWRSARSDPHKSRGVERHWYKQDFGTPVDCQAISYSPLADTMGCFRRVRRRQPSL